MAIIKIEMEIEEFNQMDNERKQLLELRGRVFSAIEYIKNHEYSLSKQLLLAILEDKTIKEDKNAGTN